MPKPGYPFLKPIRWEGDVTELPLVPRRKPRQAPEPGIFDAPFVCVPMNISWLPHIWGALDTLNQPDTWQGTDEETFIARQQIEKLLLATVEGSELCKPEPRMIPVPELVYPPWLDGAPGCWIVELDQLDGELNIIQRVDVDYCQTEDWCPPDEWKVQPSEGGDGVNAVDINNLQQQIDALQSDLSALGASLQQAEEQLAATNTKANDAYELAQFANSRSVDNAADFEASRKSLIGSMRWYADAADAPSGWVLLAGQTIDRNQPTLSGDPVTFYNRAPGAWKDTQAETVTLPNVPAAVPVGFNADLPATAQGTGNLYADDDTLPVRVPYVKGGWHIYIGDAQIS